MTARHQARKKAPRHKPKARARAKKLRQKWGGESNKKQRIQRGHK